MQVLLAESSWDWSRHIVEDEIKAEIDPAVYEDQVSMMEMVLDVDAIKEEVSTIREQYSKY